MTLDRSGVPRSPVKRLTIMALVGGIAWMLASDFSPLSMLATGLFTVCVVVVVSIHDRWARLVQSRYDAAGHIDPR
jgi:hypothetical protein